VGETRGGGFIKGAKGVDTLSQRCRYTFAQASDRAPAIVCSGEITRYSTMGMVGQVTKVLG
jgi:hypothetical protein